MAEKLILGVDIGSTKIALSLWTAEGKKLEARRFPTLPGGLKENLGQIVALGRELAAGKRLFSIGVSGGGPVDPRRGVILDIPNSPGWKEAPVGEELSRAFSVPAAVENDANAGAVAEWRFGAGRGARDLAFLTFSTGIGAGLILDGTLYRGFRFLAGEVGHQVIRDQGAVCGCGRRGCLEAYASGAGMARRLAELRPANPSLPADAKGLIEQARRGDRAALQVLEEVVHALAHGIANLVFILNPQRVILGTIAVHAGELLLAPLRQEVERRLWPSLWEGLEILPAALGEELGDHAAFAVAPGE
ncbi:MAG: ROK family protein [Planctomycetes bacterium]|nr:ROK family protein [Planctomycetota bacterium]